jgi:hypothetical protein
VDATFTVPSRTTVVALFDGLTLSTAHRADARPTVSVELTARAR